MIRMLSSLTLILCLGLAAIAYFRISGSGSVEAREGSDSCHAQSVPLDQGYGVSQTELRRVCAGSR